MKKHIIVGGNAYADIDVVACAAAYKQLLEMLGKKAFAVITPPLNQTVSPTIRNWKIDIEDTFTYQADESVFILVDVSDPSHLNDFVLLNNIVEVFDHHHGFQDYWKKRLEADACIEPVGACATLIWEQFKKKGMAEKISIENANLLYTAIFANTLNFKASITHMRDRKAAEEVFHYASLPKNWIEHYYKEVQNNILKNPLLSIVHDTKTVIFCNKKIFFAQLELYDELPPLNDLNSQWLHYLIQQSNIAQPDYILNLISINEGKNYIIVSSNFLKDLLMKITHGSALDTNCLITSRLWLRKEILKEFIELERSVNSFDQQ